MNKVISVSMFEALLFYYLYFKLYILISSTCAVYSLYKASKMVAMRRTKKIDEIKSWEETLIVC